MPYPRHAQVSSQTTPYYHCISRCVRRAFLCGLDRMTGRSYEHRKQWVVDRLRLLGEVFCIDVCAYAVMANHHHVVVRLNPDEADALPDQEVIERWSRVFGVPALLERYRQGLVTSDAEAEAARERLAVCRQRLTDLSWFMRCLNEPIARWANSEDGVTGRFWEGRFKSQALLDEAALITCMSYVDLNPVRAGVSATPEDSDYTSIQARLQDRSEATDTGADPSPGADEYGVSVTGQVSNDSVLLPFRVPTDCCGPDDLPFTLADYLELIDWVGRAVRHDKRGAVSANAPAILTRLGIDPEGYLEHMGRRRQPFIRAIGSAERLRSAAAELGQHFLKGVAHANALFPGRAG